MCGGIFLLTLVKVSKILQKLRLFLIWNLQSWGECATINMLPLDFMKITRLPVHW